MSLQGVSNNHGRVNIPNSTDAFRKKGVNFHNRFTKIFYNIFGSGTVKIDLNGEKLFLNKMSCFKLVSGLGLTNLKFKEYVKQKNSNDIINDLQQAFEPSRAKSLSVHDDNSTNSNDDQGFLEDDEFEVDDNADPVRHVDGFNDQSDVNNWKEFLRDDTATQLLALNKIAGIAEESGDCFFDAVAQSLSDILGKKLTKQDVKNDIKNHLDNVNQQNLPEAVQYQDLMAGDIEETYDSVCQKIGKVVEDLDIKNEGLPIWGNAAVAQMVANVYQVEVRTYASIMFPLTVKEAQDSKYDDFAKFQTFSKIEKKTRIEICTPIRDEIRSFMPLNDNAKGTLELLNTSRELIGWGHWEPLSDL